MAEAVTMSRRQAPISDHDLPTDLGQVGLWSAPELVAGQILCSRPKPLCLTVTICTKTDITPCRNRPPCPFAQRTI